MRVLVCEFVTAGGVIPAAEITAANSAGLLAEGRAMLGALVADLAAIPGVAVTVLLQGRSWAAWPADVQIVPIDGPVMLSHTLRTLTPAADWTIVIAPETGNRLLDMCETVNTAGGRWLGPGPETIRLTSDKHATAEHLRAAGVAAPRGVLLAVGDPWPSDLTYPAVWKPRDGCGSAGLRLIETLPLSRRVDLADVGRLEEFAPGMPCSVAVLCGPKGCITLPPCGQAIDRVNRWRYQGGWLPIAPDLAECATSLARRAVETLPDPFGYLGVDLVLGDDPTGANDRVIEINPRLTTSYVGLRAAARTNLAAATIAVAEGRSVELAFSDDAIRFTANGKIQRTCFSDNLGVAR